MKFHPGELDKRVTPYSTTKVSDGSGGFTETKVSLAETWAHVRPMSGKERKQFDTLNAEHMYLFVFRYRTDIDETFTITWRGVDYNIRSIDDSGGRSQYLPVFAERGVG